MRILAIVIVAFLRVARTHGPQGDSENVETFGIAVRDLVGLFSSRPCRVPSRSVERRRTRQLPALANVSRR